MGIKKLISFSMLLLALAVLNPSTSYAVNCNGCVNAKDIGKNAVTGSKIKKNSVTSSKIKNSSVTTSKLKNGAVTLDKLGTDVLVNLGVVTTGQYSAYGLTGTASRTCPSGTTVLSASCVCTGDGSTRNFGVLFSCSVVGNGGVGGCYVDGTTFDPLLPVSDIELTLVCAAQPIVSSGGGARPDAGLPDVDSALSEAETSLIDRISAQYSKLQGQAQ